MGIDTLAQQLSPPTTPVDAPTEDDCLRAIAQLRIRPPEEYLRFARLFGVGSIGQELFVFIPWATNENLDLIRQAPNQLAALAELKRAAPHLVPFPLWYEPGGFFPWGVSNNGDIFGWLTQGLQGNWKTAVVWEGDPPEVFDLSMTEFLCGLLSGTLDSEVYAEAPLLTDSVFRPIE